MARPGAQLAVAGKVRIQWCSVLAARHKEAREPLPWPRPERSTSWDLLEWGSIWFRRVSTLSVKLSSAVWRWNRARLPARSLPYVCELSGASCADASQGRRHHRRRALALSCYQQ